MKKKQDTDKSNKKQEAYVWIKQETWLEWQDKSG